MTMWSLRWSVVSGQRSVVSDHYSHQRMLLRVKLGKEPIEGVMDKINGFLEVLFSNGQN